MRAKQAVSFALLSVLVLAITGEALSIPAFARKYRFSCSTCHVAVPKLKDYGEDFAANGFLLPEDEEPARAYVRTGDDELLLQRELPVAIRFDAYLQVADRPQAKTDFQLPYGIKLLSGGPISKHVSYYFYFYIDERGEVAGIEDAYVHFNNIGGTGLDIMAGQFQVSDPLFKRELRMTFEDYQIYRARPMSAANLTYDRGIMLTYGWDFGLDAALEIVNGNGIGEAHNRLFDQDNYKNWALRLSQQLGRVRIGGFGYFGKERFRNPNRVNAISMVGPDFTISTGTLEINGQYLHRKDSKGDFDPFGTAFYQVIMKGGFLEAIYMPQGDRSRWFLTLLYNAIEANRDYYDYETLTLSLSHLAARNLRLVFEYTHNLLNHEPRVAVGLVSAF